MRGHGLGLYWRLILASMTSQMQYKASFILSSLGQFAATAVEIAGVWALFSRFGNLEHWNIAEVCMFYGLVNVSFAISDAIGTGFDQFGALYVKTGHFDRLLLRPRSIFLQLIGHEFALRRVGRFSQGLAVLAWSIVTLEIDFTAYQVFMMLVTIVTSVCFFLGLFILQATLSFWSVETLEIMNTLTYGGVECAQYPMAIYEGWFRRIFTFVIPLACISYFPVIAVLGIDDPLGSSRLFQTLVPLSGPLFLGISIVLFQRVGVRHYTSTGS
ncbi:MAG: ABC-2 family transporter protein [Pseudomonadales bacterium]|nr:ABC-2 family transporter protein [Pseudomonadales bacterium]